MNQILPQVAPQPPDEVESGKVMAVLCYIPVAAIGLIVSIVCLVQANNAFALYHAKQSLTLLIVSLIAGLICIPLLFVLIGFPLLLAVGIADFVLMIIGIVNAAGSQYKPLPLVGGIAESWFGSIHKKP